MTDEQKQEAEIVQVGLDSLAFIDRTIYCNEDNPANVLWKNSEVMELLADIRAIVIADLIPQLPIGVSAP